MNDVRVLVVVCHTAAAIVVVVVVVAVGVRFDARIGEQRNLLNAACSVLLLE